MIGQVFGRWTVVRFDGYRKFPSSTKQHPVWWCRCSCDGGAERAVLEISLRNGRSKSCGCFAKERALVANVTHGDSRKGNRSPEYSAWQSMLHRCYNPNNPRYKDYGGRGITVCDKWRTDYRTFLADMGRRPDKGYSIERIDNDAGYTPENCRWASRAEQMTNLRNTLMVDGVPLVRLARLHGIPVNTLRMRIAKGWDVQDALSRPVQSRAPNGSRRS